MKMLTVAAIVLFVGYFSSCGKSGDNSFDDGQDPGGDGGTIDDNPKDVTGRFFLESTDNPASGLDVVLADWNSLTMKVFSTKDDGSLRIALSEFNETGLYSLHLLRLDRKIGDLDLSLVNSGLQSAFVYRGGYGFVLGDVIIPRDERGIIAVPEAGLEASVGGGFSLGGSKQDLRIEDFPKPDLVSSFDIKPSLIVSDPRDLYYGFHNVLDLSETSRVLAKYSALSFQGEAKQLGDVVRIFVSREASWHGTAKLMGEDFSDLSSAVFWRTTAFHLKQEGLQFSANVLPGLSLLNRLIFLKIEGEDPPQFEIPRMISSGYIKPPLLESIAMSGGSPTAIAYSDASTENGLTTPFCHSTSDITAVFSLPRDLADAPVDGTVLNQIILSFDYYARDSGVTTKIDQSAQLEAPYNKDVAESELGAYAESWQAADKALIRTMSAAVIESANHSLAVPAALLPNSLGGKTVTRIRVKVLFKGKNHPGKSGSVFWIKKDC